MRDKIALLDKAYEVGMELLLKECEDDYDRCAIYSRIGKDYTYIVRGNEHLDKFIECRLENGYRHSEIYFDESYEYVLDWFGDEAGDSLAKFWADKKIKSITLDW